MSEISAVVVQLVKLAGKIRNLQSLSATLQKNLLIHKYNDKFRYIIFLKNL